MKIPMICLGAGLLMTGCVAFPVDDHYSGGYAGDYRAKTYPNSHPYNDYDPRYAYDPRYQDGAHYKRARGTEMRPSQYRSHRLAPGQIYTPPTSMQQHNPKQAVHQIHSRTDHQRPQRQQQTGSPSNPHRINAVKAVAPPMSTRPVIGVPTIKNQLGQPRLNRDSQKHTKRPEEKKRSDQKRNKYGDSK